MSRRLFRPGPGLALTVNSSSKTLFRMLTSLCKKSTKAKGNRAVGLWWMLCVE